MKTEREKRHHSDVYAVPIKFVANAVPSDSSKTAFCFSSHRQSSSSIHQPGSSRPSSFHGRRVTRGILRQREDISGLVRRHICKTRLHQRPSSKKIAGVPTIITRHSSSQAKLGLGEDRMCPQDVVAFSEGQHGEVSNRHSLLVEVMWFNGFLS